MRYENENIEIIDAYEDIKKVSRIEQKPKKDMPKKKNAKQVKFIEQEQSNAILFYSIIFLPIFAFIYLISTHSKVLINERISVFSLIMMCILALLLIIGMLREVKIQRRKYSKTIKMTLSTLYMSVYIFLGVILYGSNGTVKDFIIDKAMSTTNHQYIATWLYDEKTINESLSIFKEATQIEITGSDKVDFDEVEYNQLMYDNEFEEQILSKENEDDLYKIINISGTTIGAKYKYKGYLVVVYDPSKVKLGVSKGAGTHDGAYGQKLSVIAKNNNAVIAMNAGGFYDPYWKSNGGIPHGAVIKDGQIQSEFRRGDVSGGLIGFNNNNELILKRMSAEEAIESGIRDAVDWGPYLIVNGKNQYANVKKYSWATSRTAIGQRKDGIVLMLVIDGGNQPGSYGASYADIAKIMENYGAINAANLDGGTSTALVENTTYVNNPWNGRKRTIRSLPNAWIVVE